MKAALIPSKGWYHTARQSHYHLVLAQIDSLDYQDVYLSEGIENDFLIVDNGAAEGNMVSDKKLFSRANFYAANEIVLPDVMMNSRETVRRAKDFFVDNDEVIDSDEHNFMGVVQALSSVEEAYDCIKAYAEMPLVKTLGIPRHLVERGDYARWQICKWLEAQSSLKDRFEVHLLGTNTRFPLEIRMIAQSFPWVRSCDSSMPYNYAIAGEKLEPSKHHIRRPLNYFDAVQNISKGLLEYNINTYLGWASGEGTRS